MKWGDVQPGDLAKVEGVQYTVLVVKPGGKKLRVVLEPRGVPEDQPVAKKALRVDPNAAVGELDSPSSPKKATGSRQKAEDASRLVEVVLGGKHVADIDKGTRRTICPPMDVTTIATHLKVMHGVELRGLPIKNEHEMLRIHEELHEAPFHEPRFEHEHESPGEEVA